MSTIWEGWRKFWPTRAMEAGVYANDVAIRVSQCCLRKATLQFLELPAAFFLSGNESTFIVQCWSLCIYLVVHGRNLRKVNPFYYIPVYWDFLWFVKPAITRPYTTSQLLSSSTQGKGRSLDKSFWSHMQSTAAGCSELSCLRSDMFCLLPFLSPVNLWILASVACVCFLHAEVPGDTCGSTLISLRIFVFVFGLRTPFIYLVFQPDLYTL